jgi:hypothetical protein
MEGSLPSSIQRDDDQSDTDQDGHMSESSESSSSKSTRENREDAATMSLLAGALMPAVRSVMNGREAGQVPPVPPSAVSDAEPMFVRVVQRGAMQSSRPLTEGNRSEDRSRSSLERGTVPEAMSTTSEADTGQLVWQSVEQTGVFRLGLVEALGVPVPSSSESRSRTGSGVVVGEPAGETVNDVSVPAREAMLPGIAMLPVPSHVPVPLGFAPPGDRVSRPWWGALGRNGPGVVYSVLKVGEEVG